MTPELALSWQSAVKAAAARCATGAATRNGEAKLLAATFTFHQERCRTALRRAAQGTYPKAAERAITALQRGNLARRDATLRRKYGVTLAHFDTMVAAQQGKCPICLTRTPIVMDHNHTTGEPRAPLCRECNAAWGLLGECIASAARLVVYGQVWGTKHGAAPAPPQGDPR